MRLSPRFNIYKFSKNTISKGITSTRLLVKSNICKLAKLNSSLGNSAILFSRKLNACNATSPLVWYPASIFHSSSNHLTSNRSKRFRLRSKRVQLTHLDISEGTEEIWLWDRSTSLRKTRSPSSGGMTESWLWDASSEVRVLPNWPSWGGRKESLFSARLRVARQESLDIYRRSSNMKIYIYIKI